MIVTLTLSPSPMGVDAASSKRGNINTAALVTIAQCSTLVRCSRQLIGPADWVFVTLAPLRYD